MCMMQAKIIIVEDDEYLTLVVYEVWFSIISLGVFRVESYDHIWVM